MDSIGVAPLFDRIVIDPQALPEKSTSGKLHLPAGRSTRPKDSREAIVLAVGPGRPMKNGTVKPMELRPGDRILYPEHTGSDFDWNGKTYLMITEQDALALLEHEQAST